MNALDRTLGFFPISIATSLALEGLYQVGEHADDHPALIDDAAEMEEIWINIRTLARNCLGAFESSTHSRLTDFVLRDAIQQDIDQLKETIEKQNKHRLVFYMATHKTINRQLPEMRFRHSNADELTEKQKLTESFETKLIKYAVDYLGAVTKTFDTKLHSNAKVIIITHQPIDLLSYYYFPGMVLLESHTGKVKSRMLWATKLNTPKKTECIPFTLSMLTVFGDGNMIAAQDLKLRKVLLKLGEKYHWHAMTTDGRVLTDAKLAYEPFLVEYLQRVGKYKLS